MIDEEEGVHVVCKYRYKYKDNYKYKYPLVLAMDINDAILVRHLKEALKPEGGIGNSKFIIGGLGRIMRKHGVVGCTCTKYCPYCT